MDIDWYRQRYLKTLEEESGRKSAEFIDSVVFRVLMTNCTFDEAWAERLAEQRADTGAS